MCSMQMKVFGQVGEFAILEQLEGHIGVKEEVFVWGEVEEVFGDFVLIDHNSLKQHRNAVDRLLRNVFMECGKTTFANAFVRIVKIDALCANSDDLGVIQKEVKLFWELIFGYHIFWIHKHNKFPFCLPQATVKGDGESVLFNVFKYF